MYNGVGVQTARSTGTSGHVVKSLGQLQPRRNDVGRMKEQKERISARREEDPDITLHNALRKIEVKLAEYREQLEDEYVLIILCLVIYPCSGLSDGLIEEKISERREALKTDLAAPNSSSGSPRESPEQAKRNERLKSAFGVRRRDDDSSSERSRSRSRSQQRIHR